jgi:hypothetical protein
LKSASKLKEKLYCLLQNQQIHTARYRISFLCKWPAKYREGRVEWERGWCWSLAGRAERLQWFSPKRRLRAA